ncbi:MAG: hypothetical protein OJF51_001890 [Nitrospira sp.]|jgi:hypothetical protein|nr:MAG: hypothetical protein OJF51_001890 [Nitrospira sp.]
MSFRKQRAARNLRESHNFLGIILFIPEEELHELNLFRFSESEQIHEGVFREEEVQLQSLMSGTRL